MTTKWFTSDLHFSHKNIVKFTNRGKDTTQEEHDEWLIDVWNSQVNNGDLVYHLGDFSFATKYNNIRNIVVRLNGNIFMIKGNHDSEEMLDALADDNLFNINWSHYKEIKLKGQDYKTVLFHFPIGSWHKQAKGSIHLHGHSHGNYLDSRGKMLDVGLDSAYNIFGKHKFFSEDEVLELMRKKKIYVSDHHRENV